MTFLSWVHMLVGKSDIRHFLNGSTTVLQSLWTQIINLVVQKENINYLRCFSTKHKLKIHIMFLDTWAQCAQSSVAIFRDLV